MINSLRPLLADCPPVLQQKWHWEHLSMLPDNAHKCEICQTQYVNNHNCTGWGHVRVNPTEMLLDDCGVSRFQRCDFLQCFLDRKNRRTWGAYVQTYVYVTLVKTCRPCRRHGPQKAKSNCSFPLIYTNYREDKQKLRSWKKEIDCREVFNFRKLEVGKGQGKKIQSKLREEQMRSQDKPVLRAPKTAISP